MCEATTISLASLAIGGATAAAGVVGQNEAYGDAVEARNRRAAYDAERFQQTVSETTRDVFQQIETLRVQADQVRQSVFSQIRAVAGDARKAAGVAKAVAAERGVQGRSVEAQIDEFERDFSEFENMRLIELSDRRRQYNLEEQAIRNRGQSIINSGYPQPLPPIRGGSPLVPILQGATAGLSVAGSLSSLADSSMFKGLADPRGPMTPNLPQNINTSSVFGGPQIAAAPGIRFT